MLSKWKYRLTHEWTIMRILRLGLSIILLAQALRTIDVLFSILAVILLLQALFNIGFCAGGECFTRTPKPSEEFKNTEIIYEEINDNRKIKH